MGKRIATTTTFQAFAFLYLNNHKAELLYLCLIIHYYLNFIERKQRNRIKSAYVEKKLLKKDGADILCDENMNAKK